MGDGQIVSAVWRAAVVLLFPVLEEYRFDFILRHKTELEKYLPITNSNGEFERFMSTFCKEQAWIFRTGKKTVPQRSCNLFGTVFIMIRPDCSNI